MRVADDVKKALLALLFVAATAGATTTFLSPQSGAQAFGPMHIEITTDATNVDRVEFHVDGALAGVARKPPYRIAYDFGTSLEARTITAKVWSNGYKSSESASIVTAAMSAGETLNVDLVEVPLRVRASRTLSANDLRVRENGVDQTIREIKTERPPAHFAFIIDRSLSMNGGKLAAALRAVDEERKQLRAGDTTSVILFNHNVARPRTLAANERLARVFGDVVPSGGTSLRDALASIRSRERTYAIVITDGGDRNSELSEEAALRRISGTKTFVHALVLGDTHARFLDRAAANTGGSVVEATKETVARELRALLADINSRYLVVYQSSGSAKGGWRSVDVSSRRKGVQIVSARKGYFAE